MRRRAVDRGRHAQGRALFSLLQVPAMDRNTVRHLGLVRARRRAVDGDAGRFPVIAPGGAHSLRRLRHAAVARLRRKDDVALAVGAFDQPDTARRRIISPQKAGWHGSKSDRVARQGDAGAMMIVQRLHSRRTRSVDVVST